MDITHRLRGHTVKEVITNGTVLCLVLEDGLEFRISWVDDHGVAVNGLPVVHSRGFRLRADGMRDIIQLPVSA